MPLYDLECPNCGCEIEVLQSRADEGAICSCGSKMERIYSNPPMIIIRGEGGYPSRRKQFRNTTFRNHPQLEPEKNRTYIGL